MPEDWRDYSPAAAAIERDAARYRWLRVHQDCLPDLGHCSRDLQARTLDAFLDAELTAEHRPV